MEHITYNMEHRTWNKKQEKELGVSSAAPCPGGFSLVETIVAIAILSVAIIAPMSLARQGLSGAAYARDQVTAFYLAQEAIEFARNTRDNNNLQDKSGSSSWLSGLGFCMAPNRCGIDVTAAAASQVVDCSVIGNCLLTFNTVDGIYGLRQGGSWRNTIFTRTLQIASFTVNGDSNAADLTATVTWMSGKISKSLTVSEKIFDWFPKPAQ